MPVRALPTLRFLRQLRHKSMPLPAHPVHNARRDIVSTVFAAIKNATTNAWPAAWRKKAAESMAFAARSNTTPIRTMIVPMVRVMGKTNAKITTASPAHPQRSVCRIFALTGIVATTFAWAVAKPAVPRKKETVKTVFAVRSKPQPIPTTNARMATAMARGRVRRVPNQHFPMARPAHRVRNALPDIVPMACVAIAGV